MHAIQCICSTFKTDLYGSFKHSILKSILYWNLYWKFPFWDTHQLKFVCFYQMILQKMIKRISRGNQDMSLIWVWSSINSHKIYSPPQPGFHCRALFTHNSNTQQPRAGPPQRKFLSRQTPVAHCPCSPPPYPCHPLPKRQCWQLSCPLTF